MITAYIDFKSLDCFLAIKPVIHLAKSHGVSIEWRAFQTAERALPTQVSDERVTRQHHQVRLESEFRLQQHYADLRKLQFDPASRHVDTTEALQWLASLEGDTTAFVERVFHAHWCENQDINDTAFLTSLTEACGLSRDASNDDLPSLQREAESAGLFGAPTFFIQGHMFMGRAHIPWMRRLLAS